MSTTLLLVVGTTNYWLYHTNTTHLKALFDSAAQTKLDDITRLSGYYISHYEYELLDKLVSDTSIRPGILHISIKTIDDSINLEEGQRKDINHQYVYTQKIIYNNDYIGNVELTLDNSSLKHGLQQTLINSSLLIIITVSLIGTLLFLFFRHKVMVSVNLAYAEKDIASKEKEFFSLIMDTANSLVIVLNKTGRISLANNTCKHYLADSTASVENRYIWDCFPIICNKIPMQKLFNNTNKEPTAENINYLMTNTGISICELNNEKVIIQWSFKALHDDRSNTSLIIVTGTNETEQYLENEKLSYLAMHDALTGLPNRTLFMDRLGLTLAQHNRNNEAFCIFYLDLDKFKPINDELGHEAGDFILKKIAETLQNNLRAMDTVARLGGDEFGLILTNIENRENAALVAQKCIDAISQPFKYLTHQLQLCASIGIVYDPDHDSDLLQLINYADSAMYKAKKSGGNSFCFYE